MSRVVLIVLSACVSVPIPAPATRAVEAAVSTDKCVDEPKVQFAVRDDAVRRYAKARAIAQTGDDKDFKRATELFERLSLDYPWYLPAKRALGIVYGFRGNWVASYTAYTHYLAYPVHAIDREHVMAELRLLEDKQQALRGYAEAERLRKEGDLARASSAIRRVIGIKPNFSLAHRTLGSILLQQNKRAEALESLELYLRLDPMASDRTQVEAEVIKLREGGR